MFLFLAYYLVSVFFARSFAEALADYQVLLVPLSRIIFFLIFLNINSKKVFQSIVNVFVVAAVFESLLGVTQVLFQYPIPEILEKGLYQEPRNYFAYLIPLFSKETIMASGTFEHFNGLAGFLILALPVAFGLWLNNKHAKRYLISSAIILIGIICTFSRGALISAIVVLLFQYFSFNKNVVLKRVLIISLLLVIALAFTKINTYVEDTGNTTSRYLTWLVALEHAFSQPWRLIHGFGLFYFRDNVLVDVLGNLHSSFLQIFLEMGLIGIILYYKAMKQIIIIQHKNKSEISYSLIAIILGFTISQFLDNNLFSYVGTLFIALLGIYLSQSELPINKIVFTPLKKQHD